MSSLKSTLLLLTLGVAGAAYADSRNFDDFEVEAIVGVVKVIDRYNGALQCGNAVPSLSYENGTPYARIDCSLGGRPKVLEFRNPHRYVYILADDEDLLPMVNSYSVKDMGREIRRLLEKLEGRKIRHAKYVISKPSLAEGLLYYFEGQAQEVGASLGVSAEDGKTRITFGLSL